MSANCGSCNCADKTQCVGKQVISTTTNQENRRTEWTKEEEKKFETSLCKYDIYTRDRWSKIAAMLPRKTAVDVKKKYEELRVLVFQMETGLIPIPDHYHCERYDPATANNRSNIISDAGGSSARTAEHESNKGGPKTEKEHK